MVIAKSVNMTNEPPKKVNTPSFPRNGIHGPSVGGYYAVDGRGVTIGT